MDKSYDASKSESSSEEEWMDLSKSDYAKVIFSNLYWNSVTGDVGCYFALTETVSKNPLDYIGIYKVGYDNLSQCLAMKNLSNFNCKDDSKPIHCGFKSEELPELNGFYQFLYVTHEKEVCGASMPFEVKLTPKKTSPVEEVVTERIENDFLMVRYGLEQKNNKLETLLKTYQSENVVLVTKIRELRGEKAVLNQKLEDTRQTLHSVTQEFIQFKDEHLTVVKELESVKTEYAAVLEKCHIAQENLEATRVELEQARDEVNILSQVQERTEKIEEVYKKFYACCADFDAKENEKEELITKLNKTIKELREELKCKQNDIEKINRVNFDSLRAKDLAVDEYRKKNDHLNLEMEKLMADLMTKDRLVKELLTKSLYSPFTTSNRRGPMQGSEDDPLVVERLRDAEFMIKALEDSKHLAMNEMHMLSEKLKKTQEELRELRIENQAFHLKLDGTNFLDCVESRALKKSRPGERIEIIQTKVFKCKWQNLLSKFKEIDPSVDMDNLEQKLMDLIVSSHHKTEKINKGNAELSLLKCENMALKIFLEEKTSCGSSKETTEEKNSEVKEEKDKHSDKEIRLQSDNVLMNLLSKLKEIDPSVDMDNLEQKLMDLIVSSHHKTEKINKSNAELSLLKCENMALKIFLEEKTSCSPKETTGEKICEVKEEKHKHSDKEIQVQSDNVLMNLLSKLKEIDPSVDMDNLEQKLIDLIVSSHHKTEIMIKDNAELSLLKCENMALKIFLEEKTSWGSSKETTGGKICEVKEEKHKHSDKEIQVQSDNVLMNLISLLKEYDPNVNIDKAEVTLKQLMISMHHQDKSIGKFYDKYMDKEDEIRSLQKELEYQKRATLDALMNVEDKTARIVQAAELYKDLYKEKEKLAKQLRKLMLMKSRSKKSSISKAEDESKPNFLPLNIEKSSACSDSTSNNSDSDTGEHVRAEILYPDLKKDENYISELLLPHVPVIQEMEVKPVNECSSLETAINNISAAVKENQDSKVPSKNDSLSMQPLSVNEDTHIPCLICGESFLITPHSNIPMIEHLEKNHNMDICPLCGQLFDKSFPSKYLMFHINDHFQSE